MTLRDIFNSIIDYNLSGILEIGIIIFGVFIWIGILAWLCINALELLNKYKENPSIEAGARLGILIIIIVILFGSAIILANA